MKAYKWSGSGHYMSAVVLVVADCIKSAREMIEKELIDNGLTNSWEEMSEIQEIEINDCKIIYVDNGDY